MLMDTLYSVIMLIMFLVFIFGVKSMKKAPRLPPGPPRLPVIGNFHQLKLPIHKTLNHLSKKYGDLMFLQLGSVPAIVVSSSEVVRGISKSFDIQFSSRPALHITKTLKHNCLGVAFAPYGDYWKEVRRVVASELLSAKKVHSFQSVRREEVNRLVNSIADTSGPVNMSDLFQILSSNIICRAAFGLTFNENSKIHGRRCDELVWELQKLLSSFCLSDFFPYMGWLNKATGFDAKLRKALTELDDLCNEILEKHRNAEIRDNHVEDFVDVLLRLQKSSVGSDAFSDDSVKALIVDMFAAGTDTTSATLVWAMAELARNPEAMRKAQEEVRRVVKNGKTVEERHLKELTYLKHVINETLRLHPPAPLLVPRETTEDCMIKGYCIPAKTRVFVNAHAMAVDPELWEDPYQFQPERFENAPTDFKGQLGYIPFGFGRRICPGMNFATSVMELALASVLHHFDWMLPQSLNMEEAVGVTVHKETALFLLADNMNFDGNDFCDGVC